jgi:parvulin-like peptidyl-prolyl isomerase
MNTPCLKIENMKSCLVVLFALISAPLFAQQTVTDKFQKITTIEQAQEYIKANPELKPEILELSYGKDSSIIDKRLLRQKKGDVFSVGYVTYKVIDSKESISLRANYIFLDGGSLSKSEVDSLKKIIVQKITAGEPWAKLADQYNMDDNKSHGETGWFYGEFSFPKEFQDAVETHKLGDVFFVDVAEKQWHYIVKKTYENQITKDIKVLRSNGR